MRDGQEKELMKVYADIINGYREHLRKKIAECREKMEKERDYTIRHAEYGDFDSISPTNLVMRRVELETYMSAYNALEDHINNGGKPEGENE